MSPVLQPLRVEELTADTVAAWIEALTAVRGSEDVRLLSGFWDEAQAGKRTIWTAWHNEVLAGSVTVQDVSAYPAFRQKHIPELVDLWVMPEARRGGVARALIETAEDTIKKRGAKAIGLGVGLDRSFGPAHCFYISQGYKPDGTGVWANGKNVASGDTMICDETALLMLVKIL